MRRIIPLYIIKEIAPSFFVNLLVFTFILLMARVLQLTELVVVKGVQASTIFKLLGLSVPFLLSMTIPMSTLLAVLLAFLRLSGDSEITVLKSAGIGLYKLLPPVILFCLWTYMLTAYLTMFMVPNSNWKFRHELLNLAKTRADVSIKERVFNSDFREMVLFVNHISLNSDIMEDIFIQDNRDKEVSNVIVASTGRIATDAERGSLIFQLFDGVIDRVYSNMKTTDSIDFKRYELRMDLDGELGNPALMRKNQTELMNDDLMSEMDKLKQQDHKHYPIYLMEVHKRYSLPFACIVLGLVAVPLGVQFRARGRNWGITMGLVIFLLYFVMLSAAWTFGETGSYPPGLGMWMPNIVIGLAALYMMRKANREEPIGIVSAVNKVIAWFKSEKNGGSA